MKSARFSARSGDSSRGGKPRWPRPRNVGLYPVVNHVPYRRKQPTRKVLRQLVRQQLLALQQATSWVPNSLNIYIYIYTLSVIQCTYCFWSLIQWDLQWLVFPIYPAVWCFHAPRKFLARLETVGRVRPWRGCVLKVLRSGFRSRVCFLATTAEDDFPWIWWSIIFPSFSHDVPTCFHYFHHFSIIFSLSPHYCPIISHHLSIIFPLSSHHLSIIFPLSSHSVLGVSPMGLWEWGSLYDSGGPWGPYEFHKVLIELKWWEMTRYRRDAG